MDSEILRVAMQRWASGVTIVTSQSESFDEPRGMTVSSFTSVSLEPPLVLVCLNKELETTTAILESQVFGVSMLNTLQAHISGRFAGFDPDFQEEVNRFEGLEILTLETGAPLLKDALVHLDCRVWQIYDGSTHHIVVGEVIACNVHDVEADPNPLIYSNRGYHRLLPQDEDL